MAGNTQPIDTNTNVGELRTVSGTEKLFGRSMSARPSGELVEPPTLDATVLIGTRAYGTALPRLPYTAASAKTDAIVANEVLLHNCGAGRCYVKAGAANNVAATSSDIPLEPGEKFHLRITSGQAIAAIRDSADGNLNIVPVA